MRLYGTTGSREGVYRSQPNVRFVVDFLAKQVSGLKLKVYEKVPSEGDLPSSRIELDECELQLVLNRPSGPTSSTTANRITRWQFWRQIVSDIGVHDAAYARKVRGSNGKPQAIYRIPFTALSPQRDPISQMVTGYRTAKGFIIDPNDLIVFPGYDPEMNLGNVSPLETLRSTLAEEWAMARYREWMWKNGARHDGFISRPLDAEPMGEEALEAFLVDFAANHTGMENSGKPAFLDEGMMWHDNEQWNARETEYIAARQLNRAECAAAYGIPAAMVGAANRAATAEERTGFYSDTLTPFLARLEEEIDVQLLPDFEISDESARRRYTRFNLDEKLRGSFETQAAILSTATGTPWLLVNEARARQNLPPVPGGDKLVAPMNVQAGGGPQASPTSPLETPAGAAGKIEPAGTTPNPDKMPPAPPKADGAKADAARVKVLQEGRQKFVAEHLKVLTRTFSRQRDNYAKGKGFNRARWDKELAEDLHGAAVQTATFFGEDAAAQIKGKYDAPRTVTYLRVVSEDVAKSINTATESALTIDGAKAEDVFTVLIDGRAPQIAETRTTFASNWGIAEAARQNGG